MTTTPPLGLGVPIGLNDRKGQPIHIGDTLSFDKREWYRPAVPLSERDSQPDVHFVVTLERGEITGNGTPGDWPDWCEVVKRWDNGLSPGTVEQQARDMLDRMGVPNAQSFTSGELVELANLIAGKPDIVSVDGKKLTIRFDQIQVEGRVVRFSLAGKLVFTQILDEAPEPGRPLVISGIRGEMDGKLL